MFFTNILSLYFMVSWFPTLAHASGLELSDAVRAAATIQVGSILGTLSLAALVLGRPDAAPEGGPLVVSGSRPSLNPGGTHLAMTEDPTK